MRLSIMLEGQRGVNWQRWQAIAGLVDELGFAGLYRSDHFTDATPPGQDSLELVISLAYLATHTRQIQFGPCVAPVSFRDPIMFARQAAQLDDLSGGRMVLGLGAGWQQHEHHMFGYPLGDVATRMARYEEALEVVTRLLHSDRPVSFQGRFYQLHDAELLPRPDRAGGPPIMIGGNGLKRTLPLAAKYATIWNGVFLRPDEFAQRCQILDSLLHTAGRPVTHIRRTHMTAIHYAETEQQLDTILGWRHTSPDLAGKTVHETISALRSTNRQIVGTPTMVIEQLRAYQQAGCQEFFLQWLDLDDLDGLRSLATHVLPAFHSTIHSP